MENTRNLGLKKWEGGDRILHTEFNENWDKIDGAIMGRLGPIEEIKRFTFDEDSYGTTFDISDIEWNKWSVMVLACDTRFGSETTSRVFIVSLQNDANQDAIRVAVTPQACRILFFPRRGNAASITAAVFPQCILEHNAAAYQQITKLRVDVNNGVKISRGSQIAVYGIQ